jgi:hypothetical protein
LHVVLFWLRKWCRDSINIQLFSLILNKLFHILFEKLGILFLIFQNQFLNVMDLNSFSNFVFRLSHDFHRRVSFHWMHFC